MGKNQRHLRTVKKAQGFVVTHVLSRFSTRLLSKRWVTLDFMRIYIQFSRGGILIIFIPKQDGYVVGRQTQ